MGPFDGWNRITEGNTFKNGVQEGSVIVVSSRTIILVLNDLANKGYDLSLALHVKFDEVHSTDILDALIQMCESTQESDMKIFFEQLKGDNEVAKRKMRDGFSRAEDGESLAEYDEWSMQMSNLETIGRNCPYWEAENLYDEENPETLIMNYKVHWSTFDYTRICQKQDAIILQEILRWFYRHISQHTVVPYSLGIFKCHPRSEKVPRPRS